VGTLLGPEGTTVRLSSRCRGRAVGLVRAARHDLGHTGWSLCGGWCWCLVVGCGLVVG
jgi:hypothetical protein